MGCFEFTSRSLSKGDPRSRSCCSCVAEAAPKPVGMNLYRNFGNLMEAWVAEQSPDPELLEDIPRDSPRRSSLSSSGLEKNARAESVDSGVETASTDTFFPTSSLSTDMTEVDSFTSGVGNDNYIPFSAVGSASLPPYMSPPALSEATNRSRVQGSVVFNTKLRQALQRSESRRLSEPHGDDQRFRTPSRHRAPVLRSETFGSWKTAGLSVPVTQISGMKTKTLPSRSRIEPMQGPCEEFSTGPSPGLTYLEQVCQMWEDIAKQQLSNGGYNVDTARLMANASSSCQSLHQPVTFYSTRLEHLSNKDKQLKQFPDGHFRQRSSSETTISPTHPRNINLDSRGTFNLLDKETQDNKLQDDLAHRINQNRRIKLLSLKREQPSLQNANSHLTQSFERNAAQRQLNQLFRRRWKTLPVSTPQ